jgi:hypothetical protein
MIIELGIRGAEAWVQTVYCYLLLMYGMGWRVREDSIRVEFNTVAVGVLLLVATLCYELIDALTESQAHDYHRYGSIHGLTHLLLRSILSLAALTACLRSYLQSYPPQRAVYRDLSAIALGGLLLGSVSILACEAMVDKEMQERVVEACKVGEVLWWGAGFVGLYRPGSPFNRFAKAVGYVQLDDHRA